jgi:hypothetical protein
MTDQELKDLVASNALAISRLEAAQQKTEAQLRRTMEVLSNAGHNTGAHAEDYFYNALQETMTLAGIHYDEIIKNQQKKKDRLHDEFDIVMINGKNIALIECKYKAHENDLIKLTQKKVVNFRALFPEYAHYGIYCGLGSFSFYPNLEEQAHDLGVILLKQKGDVMHVNSTNLRVY